MKSNNIDAVSEEDLNAQKRVVSSVKKWSETPPAHRLSHLNMREICTIVEDYLDVLKGPVFTVKTPSIGTRIVHGAVKPITISETAMQAVLDIIECDENGDHWILFTKEDAPKAIDQNNIIDEMGQIDRQKDGIILGFKHDLNSRDKTIEELNKTIDDLRMAGGDMLDKIKEIDLKTGLKREEPHTNLYSLCDDSLVVCSPGTSCLCDRCSVKFDSSKSEVARLRNLVKVTDRELNAVVDQYSALCDLVDRVEDIVVRLKGACFVEYSLAADDILKIIQEDKS